VKCVPVTRSLFVCLFFSCEVCTGNKKSVCLFVFLAVKCVPVTRSLSVCL